MRVREWAAFWLLGTIWGSSFLWIKIAVADTGPVTLAAFRLLFGLAGLLVVVRAMRQPFPRDRGLWGRLIMLGALNTALPFALIPWGETRIPSGLAAILNGTTPLFALVIAHFWLHDEKITRGRAAGLALGFGGVVVLMSRDLGSGVLQSGLVGQAAVLVAALSYAVAATFARRYLRGQPPVLQATAAVLAANVMLWLAVPVVERPVRFPHLPITWLALVWLGLLGSCLAYLLYYYLISAWGATRATAVAYVFPVIGLVLGVLFLGEPVNARLIGGTLLVIAGIAMANRAPANGPGTATGRAATVGSQDPSAAPAGVRSL
ncbi:MAG TPA: EamA family transporter [bacterium]|nr:EamA family transporter [bacterium]